MVETLDLKRVRLEAGGHRDRGPVLCAMELVAWMAGESHTDRPACTCPVIGSFIRSLNDELPPRPRQYLKPHLRRLIGTRSGKPVEARRAFVMVDWACRSWVPIALEAIGYVDEAKILRGAPQVVDAFTARDVEALIGRLIVVVVQGPVEKNRLHRNACMTVAAARDAVRSDFGGEFSRIPQYAAEAAVWCADNHHTHRWSACLDAMLEVTEATVAT